MAVVAEKAPFQQWAWIELATLERAFLDLKKQPNKFVESMEGQRQLHGRAAELLTSLPARLVVVIDNVTDTISPSHYREYCLPFYQIYAHTLGGSGKTLGVHVDGRLAHLKPRIASTPIQVVESLTRFSKLPTALKLGVSPTQTHGDFAEARLSAHTFNARGVRLARGGSICVVMLSQRGGLPCACCIPGAKRLSGLGTFLQRDEQDAILQRLRAISNRLFPEAYTGGRSSTAAICPFPAGLAVQASAAYRLLLRRRPGKYPRNHAPRVTRGRYPVPC
jgi:hypothetical protein